MFWKKSWNCGGNCNLPCVSKIFRTSLNVFVNVCFCSLFGAKRKHISPNNSESAKDLVRISVLEEKLVLWWKFQFAVYVSKIFRASLNVFVKVCFFSLFGVKRKHTSPTNSESAKVLIRINVLEEKLDLWWKSQFPVKDAII